MSKDKYNFKEFKNPKRAFSANQDFISIEAKGVVRFTKGFIEKNNLEKHKGLTFHFDEARGAYGFKFYKDKNKSAKVHPQMRALKNHYGGRVVQLKSAFTSWGTDLKKWKGRYRYKRVKDTKAPYDTYVIDASMKK